ncbi:MAG: hypothetical protein AWU57_568 [Marinobacter sp. T13-3]|nr:MAG: hypothetical protein AWU57_568 [Marinobacter sp. T13-3]
MTALTEQLNELNGAEDQYRCLGVSTAHITQADRDHLDTIDSSRVMPRATGAFVKLYLHPNIPGYNHNLPGFSDAFYGVLHAAQSAGFRMVEFDTDAATYESLPIMQD